VTILQGRLVRLRPAGDNDLPELVRIRQTPEVLARWRGGDDMAAAVREDLDEPGSTGYVIELDGAVVGDHGHHRLTIDPAADNEAAIRTYRKVGFKPVGVLRRYERDSDGTWHDGLLMDLLAEEFISDDTSEAPGGPGVSRPTQ
jgi:aminoglycoside 6'-N-acetyltransferase